MAICRHWPDLTSSLHSPATRPTELARTPALKLVRILSKTDRRRIFFADIRVKARMDIFAHALWTNLLFYDASLPTRLAAIGLSVMPDVVPFGPAAIRSFVRRPRRDPATGKVIADNLDYKFSVWAYRGYDITHSLPVWLAVFAIWWLILRSVPWPMFGWLGHIAVDIPSHRRSFFGTPFLWPFSNYRYDGISWGEQWFMRLNYTSLGVMYLYLILSRWFGLPA